jgi:hypothetical protein
MDALSLSNGGSMADNQWINRIEIKSETSNRIYVVSQYAEKRFWGCSCPGWKRHRHCKHLERLGLPSSEEPFEVEEDHGKKKGFLDGYKTYDTTTGHGTSAEWRKVFAERMGLEEARSSLGLSPDAGWNEVRQAFHLAATESMARLAGDYEAAVKTFDAVGPVEEKAKAVQAAKFRLEAYAAYLAEQQQQLEAATNRITQTLLARIEAL